jgi:hypothetical protein
MRQEILKALAIGANGDQSTPRNGPLVIEGKYNWVLSRVKSNPLPLPP